MNVPTERPSDIYQLVWDKSVAELEHLVKAGVQNRRDAENEQEEEEVSDAELAQWWLDYGMSRKVTKRNCK